MNAFKFSGLEPFEIEGLEQRGELLRLEVKRLVREALRDVRSEPTMRPILEEIRHSAEEALREFGRLKAEKRQ